MTDRAPCPPPPWSTRWGQLARAAGIEPGERLTLALSGGADSVLLLHLLADAAPRPRIRAVHVDHGLRGAESRGDARFCANLCRALGVPFELARVELSRGSSLEARARRARYDALVQSALASGHTTLLTGHHSDDVLETLVMRWVRGSATGGLAGPQAELEWSVENVQDAPVGASRIRVVRPLLSLRREEVRRLLADRGLRWREDGSNADTTHTRNRVRRGLLPELERLCGPEGTENLRAFGRAVEALEDQLAAATAHLAWSPPPYAGASRGADDAGLGGVLPRAGLMELAPLLRRRALWRLITEGTGRTPGRALLDGILSDLARARCTRHALPQGWILFLRSSELHLLPPPARRAQTAPAEPREPRERPAVVQGELPFPAMPARELRHAKELSVPGIVSLADGRRISAEPLEALPGSPIGRSAYEVEVDAEELAGGLSVRWPERGDRFRALGAPGSKRLSRFLADRGLPREERPSVPLVFSGEELIWVAGLGIADRARVRSGTRRRIRLTLHPPLEGSSSAPAPGSGHASPRSRKRSPEAPDRSLAG